MTGGNGGAAYYNGGSGAGVGCTTYQSGGSGASGGKAVNLNGNGITWVSGCTARVYGAVS